MSKQETFTGSQFTGLPMEALISKPLTAAANAQGSLALLTEDFIKRVGLEEDSDTPGSYTARTVSFSYNLPVPPNKDGEIKFHKCSIQVPILAIVNVPSLSVKKVEIEFSMEVKTASSHSDSVDTSTTISGSYGGWWSPWSGSVTGNVSTSDKNERSSSTAAKYFVKVEARDDGPPEGLSKVLDILASAIPTPSDMKDLMTREPVAKQDLPQVGEDLTIKDKEDEKLEPEIPE